MTGSPILDLATQGVVAVNSPDYVRLMLSNLTAGVVSVPLRDADDDDRKTRTGTQDVIIPELGGGWISAPFASQGGDDPAMVSFSSGTEGAPKAVLLSRGNLHDVVTRLTDAMEITSEIREYVAVPVYHSFGYGRCRVVLNQGGECYVSENGLDVSEVRQMLAQGQINALSAVPSQWRILLQNSDVFGAEFEAIRWAEIGSQFMSAEEKLQLRALLPNAKIVQHYGLTEASRTTLLRIHAETAEVLGSVGRAEGGVAVRIGKRGRIEICGPNVALGVDDGQGYQPLGSDHWLETSDRGTLKNGLLYFDGRADEVINCAGIKLSPDLIEAHVHEVVPDAGAFGILRGEDPLRGDGILVALTPDAAPHEQQIVAAVHAYAKEAGVDAAGAIQTCNIALLPRTSTGKLKRRVLARTLADTPEPTSSAPPTAPPDGLAATLQSLLGPDAYDRRATFLELGGDSLTHMQITLALERATGVAPQGWEWTPFGELIDQAEVSQIIGENQRESAATPPLPTGATNMNPPGISFWNLVREDYRTNDASVFHQGFLMLLVHRFGNLRMGVRWRLLRAPLTLLYRVLNKFTQILFGMKLDYTVKVGRRVKLEHFGGMILGAREIGDDVILRQNTTLGIRSTGDLRAKPTIGKRVDIGAGAVIAGNIVIGDDSIIGANSVVYTSVPANSVVIGVPARLVGTNPRKNPSVGHAPDST